jgi:hypothetical protein
MRITGYSERGVVNSLLYEILHSRSPERLLADLLAMVHFPLVSAFSASVSDATVLVEQSLSDFGDADAILLLRTDAGPMTMFLQAKVKPSQASLWRIEEEFQRFTAGTGGRLHSSNLFTQLYHKVRFVSALKHGGIAELQRGVPFPSPSTRSRRKIGSNPVVLRAAKQIELFLAQVRYVALVPEEPEPIARFAAAMLAKAAPRGYEGWDTQDYGFLCWFEVEQFCRKRGLANTVQAFEFNRGQIY